MTDPVHPLREALENETAQFIAAETGWQEPTPGQREQASELVDRLLPLFDQQGWGPTDSRPTDTSPAAHLPRNQSWVKVRAEMARHGLMWDQLTPWWSPDTNSAVDPLADPETYQSVRHFVAWLWGFAVDQEAALEGWVSREEYDAVRDKRDAASAAAGGPGTASTPATEPPR